MSESQLEELETLLNAAKSFMEAPKRLPAGSVANDKYVGLSKLYNFAYRPISEDAAHPTIDAMRRHLRKQDSGRMSLVFTPQETDLRETISFAISGILTCFEAIAHVFNREDISAFVDEHVLVQAEIFKKLQ